MRRGGREGEGSVRGRIDGRPGGFSSWSVLDPVPISSWSLDRGGSGDDATD